MMKKGFSLLELSAIMFIIVILLGFVIPRFPRLFESDLQLETQKLAQLITNLRQEAILHGVNHKLIIDTKKSELIVMTAPVDRPDRYKPHHRFDAPLPLKDTVTIAAVSMLETAEIDYRFAGRRITFDKIFGQQFEILIDASGFIDPFTVRFKDNRNQMTLSVVNVMGQIRIGEAIPL